MEMLLIVVTLIAFSLGTVRSDDSFNCPQSCTCTKPSVRVQPPLSRWVKLKCGSNDVKVSTTDELDFGNLSNHSDIITLDLSGNNLTLIPTKVFSLPGLQKLDLNNNLISKVEDGAFKLLTNLKRLDLSNNRIRRLNKNMFENLHNLERLKLSQNFLSQIKEGTFDELVSLKQIDLTGNPLVCDCSLWWILEWARNSSVKFSPLPKCDAPPLLHGQPLRKLKASSQCPWPHSEYHDSALELNPSFNQVVFEGDPLNLHCRALTADTSLEDSVNWMWADQDPAQVFQQTIQVENRHIKDNGFIESMLVINQLQTNHSGQWRCQLYTGDGNHTSSISVIVINNHTVYCPLEVTKDNKGVYTWPKTVAGHLVQVPCAVDDSDSAQASYMCTQEGTWELLSTENCPFASETTRILEQFSKMNLSSGEGSVIESLRRFHNFTCDENKHFADKVDIAFIATTVDNYLSHVPRERELAELLVEIVNSVMKQPREVLTEAQSSFNACSRLVSAMETIAQIVPAFQAQKANIAVQEFAITRREFHGLTCTWYSHNGAISDFLCFVANETAFLGTKDKVVEASIQVPARLFEQLEVQGIPSSVSGEHLLVAMYSSGRLFPQLNSSKQVTSCVVGTKLMGMSVEQLSEPVYVMLRAPLTGSPRPAWWHPPTLSWRHDGCRLTDLLQGLLVFQCNRLGYFSLLQDTTHLTTNQVVPRQRSRLTHPAVYIGTFISVTCLLVTSLTYMVCYSSIQMSNKAKHSLSNTWVAISALCLLFSLGIYETEDLVTCEVIGLFVHYLTLCSLFWMAVTINGMYKRMVKSDSVPAGSEELPGEPVVVGQPLVGLYLVGWGIAGLICGLSGAVNLPHYAPPCHCSLGPGPGVSALLVPCVGLVIYLLIRSLMVRCATLSLDSNAQLSEGTQNTDLELLDNTVPPERSSLHSVATPPSQVEDLEHSPSTQLKAFLIVLMLFLLIWTSAALAVLKPFSIPYEETIFSIAYAFFAVNLGMFVVFFHCFARNDVRTGWFSVKPCFRTRNVSDSRAAPPPVVSSSDSLNSSSGLKSAAITLNSSPPPGATKNSSPGNVNLVLLHRRQYHSNNLINSGNEAEVFYNPHQSGVARKFFKKQRRKQNNLGTRRSGDGGGSPSPYIGGAKVNNTNFHVEYKEERPSSNPNILHGDAPLERLVIGAEGSQPILNNDGSFRLGYSTEDQGSLIGTDCGRGMSGSSQITMSEQSDGSHLYATIDPPSPFHKRRKYRPNPIGITIDSKNESVRLNINYNDYSVPITSDSEQTAKSTDDSLQDKKETCV